MRIRRSWKHDQGIVMPKFFYATTFERSALRTSKQTFDLRQICELAVRSGRFAPENIINPRWVPVHWRCAFPWNSLSYVIRRWWHLSPPLRYANYYYLIFVHSTAIVTSFVAPPIPNDLISLSLSGWGHCISKICTNRII